MNHYIVTESSGRIRAMAREHLKGNWGFVCSGMALFLFLSVLIPEIFQDLVPFGKVTQTLYTGETAQVSMIASFYEFFFAGVFSVGLCVMLLAFVRLKDRNVGYIFDGFEYYLRCLALSVVMAFFVFLWSLLFLIPGIIAAIRYSQAPYILADDPSKGVMQCIRESKQMMTGNKMNFFVLNLSFIGWLILGSIPGGVISMVLKPMPGTPMNLLAMVITLIPLLFVLSYMETAVTVFYEMASGHLRPREEPVYTYPEGQDPWDQYNMK